MKLYAIIVAAILTAAAAIYGAISWQQAREREAARIEAEKASALSIIRKSIEKLEIIEKRLHLNKGQLAEWDGQLLKEPAQIATLLRDPLPDGTDRGYWQDQYISSCEKVIAAARAYWSKYAHESEEWAAALEKNLRAEFGPVKN